MLCEVNAAFQKSPSALLRWSKGYHVNPAARVCLSKGGCQSFIKSVMGLSTALWQRALVW